MGRELPVFHYIVTFEQPWISVLLVLSLFVQMIIFIIIFRNTRQKQSLAAECYSRNTLGHYLLGMCVNQGKLLPKHSPSSPSSSPHPHKILRSYVNIDTNWHCEHFINRINNYDDQCLK